jgi:hypothetical protein
MRAKKKPNAVTCDVVESAGMTRAVQLSKGVLTLLAASLVLGGIFWRVGLGAPGEGSTTLAVVHAGPAQPQTIGIGQASHSETQPKRHQVSLSWHAGPPTGASTEELVNGYNVYRRIGMTANYVKINSNLVLDTDYVDNFVRSGETYEYETTAVNYRGVESGASNRVVVKIPYP